MRFSSLFLLALAGSFDGGPVRAEISTAAFLESCRLLVDGQPGGTVCESMLEGAIGAFGLIGQDFFPLSAGLGYCLDPFLTPDDAAKVIVTYADRTPDCAQLAHFSMCMNLAFQRSYSGSC